MFLFNLFELLVEVLFVGLNLIIFLIFYLVNYKPNYLY